MVIEEKNKVKLGYARTSTDKQTIDNQINELKKQGILEENIYSDDGISGLTPAKKRPGFKKVYERISKGEVEELHIFELSRLGRNSRESVQLFLEIELMDCRIISISPNESWTRITDIPGIRTIFTAMFAWFADIEHDSLSERTKLGIQRARDEGKTIGRPEREPSKKEYLKWKAQGLKTAQIARVMQIPATTMYRWVEIWEDEERVRKNKEA